MMIFYYKLLINYDNKEILEKCNKRKKNYYKKVFLKRLLIGIIIN